jgi:Na+/H+ antiporter NhaD/arsenite permease-like protein
MLLSIAILPLMADKFWDKNINKLIIALVLSFPTVIWMIINDFGSDLIHTLAFDYIPFIILLGALFIITGGILIDGNLRALPKVNASYLAIGAILASLMGTTGAAMLLIRPLLHTNRERKFKVHTVLFFIAIVANCGGLLTPIGDPPLFMLYLRGTPFTWFFNLLPEWLLTNALLITIYYFVDLHFIRKESQDALELDRRMVRKIRIKGELNFVWLTGVVLSVAIINIHTIGDIRLGFITPYVREISILAMAVLSLIFTKKSIRRRNRFSWHPIEEVAYLFLGIFITMVPCLLFLEANASNLGIMTAVPFYYASGSLSSFLDNTPTAVTFYSLAKGLVDMMPTMFTGTEMVAGIPASLLKAISTASVFFGAMTYIGNGPNFMIKAIAQHHHVKMPHFFEYMYKFSLIVLLPIFILIKLIFIW